MLKQVNFDVAIIGGGPAGLTAAIYLNKYNLKVALIDERRTLGGQIYKRTGIGFKVKNSKYLGKDFIAGAELINKFESTNVTSYLESTVLTIEDNQIIAANVKDGTFAIKFKKLIVATGAYDRPVVFPGWTLPGVMTAGAAQTLVKTQQFSPGREMIFAGSGPLALAFPAQMAQLGAPVKVVLEAAKSPNLLTALDLFSVINGNLNLILDAIKYRLNLIRYRIPIKYRTIIVSAEGNSRVERVTFAKVDRNWNVIKGSEETLIADTLIIGYGFLPSIEILRLLGCKLNYDENRGGFTAQTDSWCATTVDDVFAVGDGTGISGSYVAKLQGALAALKISNELEVLPKDKLVTAAAQVRKELRQRLKFQNKINQMFVIGEGIFQLADSETIICRCESIKLNELSPIIDSTIDLSVAKAYSRAGMGLCQGRNCQRQIAALIAAKHKINISQVPVATPRLPLKPIAIGLISDDTVEEEKYFFND